MSVLSEAAVLDALRAVKDPDLHKDIVSLGFVKNLKISGGDVRFTIELTTPACPVKDLMRDQARAAVAALPGAARIDIEMTASVRSAASMADGGRPAVEGVKNIIAVGAGKGGVGKTTMAVNLAAALAARGSRVAILDGDLYGPNVPIMLGVSARLETDGKKIVPVEKFGIQAVSMGFLTDDDAAVIWRGPMLHGAIQQFFRDVRWTDIDYLIVDMPPGTGDVALSLSQSVPVAGAVLVTTPQSVSVADTRRAVQMYRKLNIPVLGLIENMSHFVCPGCGRESDLFGRGGGERLASEVSVPFLGRVPLHEPVRTAGDAGVPIIIGDPESAPAKAIAAAADRVAQQVSIASFSGRAIPLTEVR
jgi:ATP-binding protein involved in chromosome partitioning